jgi:2-polyprenyl-6-methoxyphenol hydroxylase-like FAD-dependent oxidoreductase
MSNKAEVLIVGAGPVGLSAALALAKAKIPIRIIDRLSQPTNQSRAAILQVRVLENFERLGVVDDFLTEGVKIHGASIYAPGNVLLIRPSFDHLPTHYPFMLGLEQFKTEALLAKRLKTAGIEVERGTELLNFKDTGDRVSVRLKHPDGNETVTEFNYLLGSDGGHSTVRAGLGLRLEGETLDATWITADVKIRWDRDPSEAVALLSEDGVAFIAAMNDERWRVIVTGPQWTQEHAAKASLEEVQNIVNERFGTNISLYDPVWISAFGINTRMAPTMSCGRIFLAGDAAHVHSPVGGQGMNTGIQDALNLAWKLALVIQGLAKPELLASYNAERHYNAKRLLSRVGPATRIVNLRSPVAIAVRNQVMHVLGHLGMSRVFPRVVSMLDVGYPESPINSESHTSWLRRGPRSGERAPDAEELLVAGKTELQRLFSLWSGDDRHQLLVFGNEAIQIPASPLYAVTHVLREGVPSDGVVVDTQGYAHEAYAVHKEGAIYLVRPDGIVAFRSSEPDTAALSHYLSTWYNGGSDGVME